MNIQALVDGMNAQMQRTRAESQMTLGKLIAALESMPEGTFVANLHSPHSYRGYYSDLAFKQEDGTRPAADLLADCRACMGQSFEGYKGGNFVMGALTPLWVASYGNCGLKLMALHGDGAIETGRDDD